MLGGSRRSSIRSNKELRLNTNAEGSTASPEPGLGFDYSALYDEDGEPTGYQFLLDEDAYTASRMAAGPAGGDGPGHSLLRPGSVSSLGSAADRAYHRRFSTNNLYFAAQPDHPSLNSDGGLDDETFGVTEDRKDLYCGCCCHPRLRCRTRRRCLLGSIGSFLLFFGIAALVLFLVRRSIVQSLVDKGRLEFVDIHMSDPQEDSVLLTAEARIGGVSFHGITGTMLPAQMRFVYGNRTVGRFATDRVVMDGSSKRFQMTSRLHVTDPAAFRDFSLEMINRPSVECGFRGGVTLEVHFFGFMTIEVAGVRFDKITRVAGLNGLSEIRVQSFDVDTNPEDGRLVGHVRAVLNNPSIVSLSPFGSLVMDLFVGDQLDQLALFDAGAGPAPRPVGQLTTAGKEITLVPGENELYLLAVVDDRAEKSRLEELMSAVLRGDLVTLIARSPRPDDEVYPPPNPELPRVLPHDRLHQQDGLGGAEIAGGDSYPLERAVLTLRTAMDADAVGADGRVGAADPGDRHDRHDRIAPGHHHGSGRRRGPGHHRPAGIHPQQPREGSAGPWVHHGHRRGHHSDSVDTREDASRGELCHGRRLFGQPAEEVRSAGASDAEDQHQETPPPVIRRPPPINIPLYESLVRNLELRAMYRGRPLDIGRQIHLKMDWYTLIEYIRSGGKNVAVPARVEFYNPFATGLTLLHVDLQVTYWRTPVGFANRSHDLEDKPLAVWVPPKSHNVWTPWVPVNMDFSDRSIVPLLFAMAHNLQNGITIMGIIGRVKLLVGNLELSPEYWEGEIVPACFSHQPEKCTEYAEENPPPKAPPSPPHLPVPPAWPPVDWRPPFPRPTEPDEQTPPADDEGPAVYW